MNVTFEVREAFFDRPKVIASLKKAKRKALSKAGAFVRRRARSSMRRRKSASAPGSPPSAHSSNTHSLKTILFAYQPQSQSAIVGPVQLNQVNFSIESVTSTVAGLHERGETAIIREYRYASIDGDSEPSDWRRVDGRRRYQQLFQLNDQRRGYRLEFRRRQARYPKRPFMRPALEAEAPNFPELFKNSIAAVR
jgi:hypothetical protein